jgi:hypothetical protein
VEVSPPILCKDCGCPGVLRLGEVLTQDPAVVFESMMFQCDHCEQYAHVNCDVNLAISGFRLCEECGLGNW